MCVCLVMLLAIGPLCVNFYLWDWPHSLSFHAPNANKENNDVCISLEVVRSGRIDCVTQNVKLCVVSELSVTLQI